MASDRICLAGAASCSSTPTATRRCTIEMKPTAYKGPRFGETHSEAMCCPSFMKTPLKRRGRLSPLLSMSKSNDGARTSICQQRSKDALRAPQVALRISLELLFVRCIRLGKCTFVIDRSEYGRLCVMIPRVDDLGERRTSSTRSYSPATREHLTTANTVCLNG